MPRWQLLFLLAVGAGVRFWALDRHSLWTDEFFTLRHLGLIWAPLAPAEAMPPLYFLLLKYWGAVAGTTPSALRAFSALWGVAGLVIVWGAAARLFSPRAGLFALALTALSPFHLAYSQEARPYAMVFALSAVSMWSLAEVAQLSGEMRSLTVAPRIWPVLYAVSTAALLYTHYWGLFVWLGGALFAVWAAGYRPGDAESGSVTGKWRTLLLVALPALSFLPYLPALAATIAENVMADFWVRPPSLANLGQALVVFTGAHFHVGGWLFSLGPVVFLAVALWSAVWISGLITPASKAEPNAFGLWTLDLGPANTRRWLLCYATGTLLVPFAVSFLLPGMFVPFRYTMAALPVAIWLAACGWDRWEAGWRAALAAALLLILASGDLHYFTGYRKGNVREAAELVAGLPAADTVLIVPAYLEPLWKFYYRGALPTIAEAGIEEMRPQFEPYVRAVFVTLDVPNVVKEAMDARYRLVAQRRYPADFHLGLVVAVYRLR